MPEKDKKESKESKEPEKNNKKEAEEIKKIEGKIEGKPQLRKSKRDNQNTFDKDSWKPKTELGKKVKNGEIKNIGEILSKGKNILEPEIVDFLLPDLKSDLLLVGQSKGKFGGGARRVFKQTQKKTREGNKPNFATFAVVGNENGFVGLGYGKSKETVPAREKAIRNAKLNIIQLRRGCGSWECGCNNAHSIPFSVIGKCGVSKLKLIPAPNGTGLVAEPEIKKILSLAGIQDIWSKTIGQTKTRTNTITACFKALKKLSSTKIRPEDINNLGIIDGALNKKAQESEE